MNRKTVTKEFENMYGEGKPLHYTTNKSINNLLKEIPNKNYENNVVIEPEPTTSEPIIPYSVIFFLILLLFIVIFLYYFRDKIANYFKGESTKEDKEKVDISKNVVDTKSVPGPGPGPDMNEFIKKYEQNNIKTQEDSNKMNQLQVNQGGVQQLNNKIDTITSYKQEQLIKENSYCYIGTENGQRECTNVYAGEVCMSGQIFPKMAVCINPHLRD